MENKTRWLQKPNVSGRWALSAVAVWILTIFLVQGSQIADDLENKVTLPAYFRVRDALDRSPKMNPRIKVYGIDDSTVSWLKSANPTMEQWSELIRWVDQQQPAAIIIDAMFSIANIPPGREKESVRAIEQLAEVKSPVIVGAFAAPKEVPFREKISIQDPNYDLTRYIRKPLNYDVSLESLAKSLNLTPARSPQIYGPDPILRPYFARVGQILYGGNSRFIPFLRVSDTQAIPHLMVYTDPAPRFYKGQLFLNQTRVPTYEDGTAPINFNSFRYYLGHTDALRFLMDPRFRDQNLQRIESGDFVYIIPPFYTGNTDFKLTPFGHMPAGYAHLAVLNSILNRDWLMPVNYTTAFVIMGAFLGAGVAIKVNSIGFALALIGGAAFWVGSAMYLFSFHNLLMPLMLPIAGYLGPLIAIFIEKSRVAEKKSQYIRHALDGAIRPTDLEELAKYPGRLNFEARERVVTVMFIDVVGFSLLAENQLPRIAFDSLKAVLSDITKTVHDYGGIVNKNLGDGLLCFFGYSLETDQSTFDHAEKALECAIQIQKENVPKMLAASEKKEPVYPLRIGINTSSVYLGNLGTSNRLDFTVVGNGVNFAKRLEGGCEAHSVLMGGTTKELIEPLGIYSVGLNKRQIEIKHHNETVEAWEYDPFFKNPDLREQANYAHKSCRHHARLERRWNVDLPENILLVTSMGHGTLVNFSNTGLSIRLPSQLIKGSVLTLNLDSKDGSLRKKLQEKGLETVSVEVRWGYADGRAFLQGVRFRDLTTPQTIYLVDQLCEYGLANQSWRRERDRHNVQRVS
ncbi:MAG: adenylate/guanylate cyclase domain-containing protein [Oligoflexus sp.]